MADLERQREHFNSIAEKYRVARSGVAHQELKRLIWTDVLQQADVIVTQNSKVLEPMCGFGEGKKLLELCFEDPFEYMGFDYSDEVVSELRKSQPELKVVQADATTFETSEQYDIIILIGGLHHVPDHAESVVARLSSSLKPGGSFINLEPTHGNPVTKMIRDKIYQSNSLFDEETERAFSVEELHGFFDNCGLRQANVSYPGLLAYVLYYNPDAFPGLNKGGVKWVRRLYNLERGLYSTIVGKWLSFATLSIWSKP